MVQSEFMCACPHAVYRSVFVCLIMCHALFFFQFVRAYLEYRKLRLLYRERALSVQLSDKLLALESERTQLQQELTEVSHNCPFYHAKH